MVTGINSISQNIVQDIDLIDALLDQARKKDGVKTVEQVENLLKEYILAQMKGDTKGSQTLSDQISSVINQFSSDIEKSHELENKLKEIATDPSEQTPAELAYLQSLIASLKQDAATGQMDGF
jgi:phosphoenolpyruvate carboxylase